MHNYIKLIEKYLQYKAASMCLYPTVIAFLTAAVTFPGIGSHKSIIYNECFFFFLISL